eukprot:9657997-Alexandrium_andersonii.AAC.1
MLRGDRSGNGPNCTVRCSGARSSGGREVAGVAVGAAVREVVPAVEQAVAEGSAVVSSRRLR